MERRRKIGLHSFTSLSALTGHVSFGYKYVKPVSPFFSNFADNFRHYSIYRRSCDQTFFPFSSRAIAFLYIHSVHLTFAMLMFAFLVSGPARVTCRTHCGSKWAQSPVPYRRREKNQMPSLSRKCEYEFAYHRYLSSAFRSSISLVCARYSTKYWRYIGEESDRIDILLCTWIIRFRNC